MPAKTPSLLDAQLEAWQQQLRQWAGDSCAAREALLDPEGQWLRSDFQDQTPLASLNTSDTPGDKGELFSPLFLGEGTTADQQIAALSTQGPQVTSTPIPPASPGRTRYEFRNGSAFAAVRGDGSVVAWGHPIYGGDSRGVDFDGPDNNLRIVALANPFTDDRLILPQFVKTIAGVNQLILSESPVDGVFNSSASLDQEGDDRTLLAIGVDDSRLDLAGTQTVIDNTVSIAAFATTPSPCTAFSGEIGP